MKCPTCKKGTIRGKGTIEHAITVSGVKFSGKLAASLCSDCDEAIVEAGELGRFECRIAEWFAEHGVCEPEVFRFMRKALGLRATDLAALLDVTGETVSRWERGAVPVEHRALALLGAMVSDRLAGREQTQARLQALREPAKVPRRVHLDVA